MFCFQCEQTARTDSGAGCASTKGVCGKDEATADLQDVLIYQLKGIGQYASRLHALGKPDAAADSFILYGLFTTLTNVNFNRARFVDLIAEAARIRDRLRGAYEQAAPRRRSDAGKADWTRRFYPSGSARRSLGASERRQRARRD